MLFDTPPLGDQERDVLGQIDSFRERLRIYLHEPRRWHGSLRRLSFARAIHGSNTIEGYTAPLDDAAAVAAGEEPLDADKETRLALEGYQRAMTFVLQQADEPHFTHSTTGLQALHYMMTSHDLRKRPGRWRLGTIYVRNDETGEIVYEGADIDEIPKLIAALVDELNNVDGAPPLIRAGMAHLNLVMIHPFLDGNGRMARCLQSLVLARERIITPTFISIEEYLGRNTQAYYDVLTEVGNGSWQRRKHAVPWIRFILTAHLRQARTTLQRIKDSERLWGELEATAAHFGLNDRTMVALFDAALGFRVRNGTYRAVFEDTEDPILEQTATRDLRVLTEAGLLIKQGKKRGTYYVAADGLRELWLNIKSEREPRDDSDPFNGG